jgi:hypothetical protein
VYNGNLRDNASDQPPTIIFPSESLMIARPIFRRRPILTGLLFSQSDIMGEMV